MLFLAVFSSLQIGIKIGGEKNKAKKEREKKRYHGLVLFIQKIERKAFMHTDDRKG